jgi:DNA-3-methyladenine glycosylase
MRRLDPTFYLRDAREVAPDLLGRLLVTEIDGIRTSGRIIETEAYIGVGDEASHARGGPRGRNLPMFLRGGYAYVYFIYGVHYCFNVVTGAEGEGEAVLIRGIEPVEGITTMVERRGIETGRMRDLANGPGKLTVALGIGPELNGVDLTSDRRIWIEPGEPITERIVTRRIGITKSVEHPWRWVAPPGATASRRSRTRST